MLLGFKLNTLLSVLATKIELHDNNILTFSMLQQQHQVTALLSYI
jgi:hypothetical protein